MTNNDDMDFKGLFGDVKPLKQDTVIAPPPQKTKREFTHDKCQQSKAEFVFSDMYEAHFAGDSALFWYRGDKANHAKIKQLRRGDFPPDLEADLHGLTQMQAKTVLLELLHDAKSHNDLCVSIMHGHGQGILKQKIPHYLVQHPDIIGFCQAPKQYGGSACILVLMDIPEELVRR